jgi:hypothetical protein
MRIQLQRLIVNYSTINLYSCDFHSLEYFDAAVYKFMYDIIWQDYIVMYNDAL